MKSSCIAANLSTKLSTRRNWVDLTDEQRNAAKVLGYTKKNWDGKGEGKTKYENYDWKELPEDAKEAAKKLGYTKKMWDADEGW